MGDPATPLRVLVVDDEESVRFFLRRGLGKSGYHVDEAASGREAIERIGAVGYDVVLTDLVMPEVDGLAVLSAVQEMDADAVVVLMTAHGSVENAVRCIREGAFDYIEKPVNPDELVVTLRRALEFQRLSSENVELRSQLQDRYGFDRVVVASLQIVKDRSSRR